MQYNSTLPFRFRLVQETKEKVERQTGKVGSKLPSVDKM